MGENTRFVAQTAVIIISFTRTFTNNVMTVGDLVYLDLYGTTLLYVNSFKLATELMDQRGAIYSDRFKSTMFSDL